MTLIAAMPQGFFTDQLALQLRASPRTIAAYRDALRRTAPATIVSAALHCTRIIGHRDQRHRFDQGEVT